MRLDLVDLDLWIDSDVFDLVNVQEEEVQGRCAAVLSNGRRCPNASLPGSRYCGLESHQALAGIDSDNIVAFRVDQATGKLTPTGRVVETGSPSCIIFARA